MSSAAVRGAAMVAVAILAAGCGGGGSKAFTLSDAKRIAGIRPAAPGWTWPRSADESKVHDSTALSVWEEDNKLAHVDVELYRSASAAHDAWLRSTRSRGGMPGKGDTSSVREASPISATTRGAFGSKRTAPEVTYHWRRRNLVLEAHMHCFGACPGDFRRRRPRMGGGNRRPSTPRLTGDDPIPLGAARTSRVFDVRDDEPIIARFCGKPHSRKPGASSVGSGAGTGGSTYRPRSGGASPLGGLEPLLERV